MKEIIEKLWNEHFADECAQIHTKEERDLLKKAIEIQEAANELMSKEQSDAIQKYVEILYEIQSFSVKKAFFIGCEFAMAFVWEMGDFGRK